MKASDIHSKVSNLNDLARKLRARRGLRTQAQVAAAAGKKTATYTFWEGGRSEPGALSLTRACLFLGCTPNDILLNGFSSPEDELPEDIYSQLLEISALLIRLHNCPQRNAESSPISIVRQFLRDFAHNIGVIPAPTAKRASQARRRRKGLGKKRK